MTRGSVLGGWRNRWFNTGVGLVALAGIHAAWMV